ncbi:hypothetical protein ACW9IB_04390 [Pseudomonas sp. SDO524_S393]
MKTFRHASLLIKQHKWLLILLGVAFYSVAMTVSFPEFRLSLGTRHGVWSHKLLGLVRGL